MHSLQSLENEGTYEGHALHHVCAFARAPVRFSLPANHHSFILASLNGLTVIGVQARIRRFIRQRSARIPDGRNFFRSPFALRRSIRLVRISAARA